MTPKNPKKLFRNIQFESLILHTLLDMYEFSVHSFKGLKGPYYLNSVGISFSSSTPIPDVMKHAKAENAKTIYLAHTHPLANDDSLKYLGVKVDPREEIAFEYRELPIGNRPTDGDITYYSQLQKEFANEDIEIIGVVFAASGIWEFSIINNFDFNAKKFEKAYKKKFPIPDSSNFMEEWSAMNDFPSYYVEVKVPTVHKVEYKPSITNLNAEIKRKSNISAINSDIEFFRKQGIQLSFYQYESFGIDVRLIMREAIRDWAKKFAK